MNSDEAREAFQNDVRKTLSCSLMKASAGNLVRRAHLMMATDELDSVVRELTNNRVRVIVLDEFREEGVELTINLEGRTQEDLKYTILFAKVVSRNPVQSIEQLREQFLKLSKDPGSVFVRALEWFMRNVT